MQDNITHSKEGGTKTLSSVELHVEEESKIKEYSKFNIADSLKKV